MPWRVVSCVLTCLKIIYTIKTDQTMVIESPHHFRSTFLVSHESLGKKTEVKMFFNSQPWRIVKNIEKWVDTQSCVNSGDIRNSERCLQFSCPMKLCMSLVIRAAAGDHRSLFLERWLMQHDLRKVGVAQTRIHSRRSFLNPLKTRYLCWCKHHPPSPFLLVPFFWGSRNVTNKQQFGTL